MSVSGPGRVIDNGLVLYLDASNNKSYVSGSNTWYDLSGNRNTGSLINGPTYTSSFGGSIVFDGTNDYVSVLNQTAASFTLSCWLRTTAESPFGGPGYQGKGIVWSDVSGVANDFIFALLNNKAVFFTGDNGNTISSVTSINSGKWFNVVCIKNSVSLAVLIYIDAVFESSGASTSNALTANPNIHIGGNTLDNRYFNGNISSVQIYNRALSASEILQNYNLEKKRFGL